MSEASRTAAETELHVHPPPAPKQAPPEDPGSISFLYPTSLCISRNSFPFKPSVTTCTVPHWQGVAGGSDSSTAAELSKGKRMWTRTTDHKEHGKKLSPHFYHRHSPGAEGKLRSTHESVIHHLCLEIEKQANLLQLSQQDDKRQKLVDSVNRYHGLFNSKRRKHRTKDKVNEVKRNACNIALWLTTPGFKKTEKRLCVVCVTSHSESNTEGGRWMSIINVSGLTVLVGLVMQNDFFIISRSFCCLQTCDLFCECQTVATRTERLTLWLSFPLFYCQTVFSCQLWCLIFNMSSVQSFFPIWSFILFYFSYCCFLKTTNFIVFSLTLIFLVRTISLLSFCGSFCIIIICY